MGWGVNWLLLSRVMMLVAFGMLVGVTAHERQVVAAVVLVAAWTFTVVAVAFHLGATDKGAKR